MEPLIVRQAKLAARMVEETGEYRSGEFHQRRCAGAGCRVICGRYDGRRADVLCRDCRSPKTADEKN
ncbi:hypothetical protein [Micromonospora sp. NPDC000442]|uniref:hypothetical protein n=1 Tax=Micromonospora sp. NPDC000442 TaxID=3364217 RepID=UPI00369EC88D